MLVLQERPEVVAEALRGIGFTRTVPVARAEGFRPVEVVEAPDAHGGPLRGLR